MGMGCMHGVVPFRSRASTKPDGAGTGRWLGEEPAGGVVAVFAACAEAGWLPNGGRGIAEGSGLAPARGGGGGGGAGSVSEGGEKRAWAIVPAYPKELRAAQEGAAQEGAATGKRAVETAR